MNRSTLLFVSERVKRRIAREAVRFLLESSGERGSKPASLLEIFEELNSRPFFSSDQTTSSLLRDWISAMQIRPACIAWEWPRAWGARLRESLGTRIYGWIGDEPRGGWNSIVRSHAGVEKIDSPSLRSWIESALLHTKSLAAHLITCHETPEGKWLEHVAERLGVLTARLHLTNQNQSVEEWMEEFILASIDLQNDSKHSLWCSPILPDSMVGLGNAVGPVQAVDSGSFDGKFRIQSQRPSGANDQCPLVDRLLTALPDRVFAFSVRQGGRIESCLQDRLGRSEYPQGSVRLAISLIQDPARRENHRDQSLLDRGAVGWIAMERGEFEHLELRNLLKLRPCMMDIRAPILPLHNWVQGNRARCNSENQEWDFLTHCTRGQAGSWPDQSEFQFHDSMLLSEQLPIHPLVTLARILSMQRLIATFTLKRTHTASVCFSEVPLDELLAMKVYQKHLRRWDWLPYGITIRRSMLEQMGAQRVIYGNQEAFESLEAAKRGLFQWDGREPSSGNASPAEPKPGRFEKEREWRVFDDVRLAHIPSSDAFVFVSTMTEARWIARLSRFPVLVLNGH